MDLKANIESKLKIGGSEEARLVSVIRSYFKKCNKKFAVIGISGGIDSALVCYLLAKALGPENVHAYYLPYVPNEQDDKDATMLAKSLKINFEKIDIRRAVDTLAEVFQPNTRISSGNIRVRARMLALYTFGHRHNALVAGTGNRTELLLGYFTKYGDGGCDLLPIGRYYKTQVWALARNAGLPAGIIEKIPSAGMWEGQTDEKEIGVTYAEIDRILVAHFELKRNWKELEKHFDKRKVQRVKELNEGSEHKRKMPDIL